MTFQLAFTPQAIEDFSALDPAVSIRISAKLHWLSEGFDQLAPETLTGRLKGLYKLRVGDWRVLYTADHPHAVLTIHAIAHRSKVYKT